MKFMHNERKKKILRRGISFAVAFVMLINDLLVWNAIDKVPGLNNIEKNTNSVVRAAEDPGDDTEFEHEADNSIDVDIADFSRYSEKCQIYSNYHQNDKITIVAQKEGSNVFKSGFQGLGTASFPFAGSIEIAANQDIVLNLDAPLFNYVLDSVSINNDKLLEISRYYSNVGTDQTTPIIAKNVIHDPTNSSMKTWKFEVVKPSDFEEGYNAKLAGFGGFIDNMCFDSVSNEGAKLSVAVLMDTAENDTDSVAISGSGDLGLACGHMDQKTELIFSFGGTRTVSSVTTTGGHVGGLVGSMAQDSQFTLKNADTLSSCTEIRTSATDSYAGGLVGYNLGGTVVVLAAEEIADSNSNDLGNILPEEEILDEGESVDEGEEPVESDDNVDSSEPTIVPTPTEEVAPLPTATVSPEEPNDENQENPEETEENETVPTPTEAPDITPNADITETITPTVPPVEENDTNDIPTDVDDQSEELETETPTSDNSDEQITDAVQDENENLDVTNDVEQESNDQEQTTDSESEEPVLEGVSVRFGARKSLDESDFIVQDYSNKERTNEYIKLANGSITDSRVGHAAFSNRLTVSEEVYEVTQAITGTKGAGGVFGYYEPTANLDLSTSKYHINNCQVNGGGNTGGLFGELNIKYNVIITGDSKSIISNHASASCETYGGLIGKVTVDDISHSLSISSVLVSPSKTATSTYYGGCIGLVDSSSLSYVSINAVNVSAANAGSLTFGGVVGAADNSFVDVNGATVTASSFKGGGLIGSLDHGVLRLDGTINLSGASALGSDDATEMKKIGRVVGWRDDALVFAKNSCTLTTSSGAVDDIGSWGQVIRFKADESVEVPANNNVEAYTKTKEKLGGTEVLSVNESTHVVTIASPSDGNESYKKIASVSDYAKTALCFQLDANNNDFIEFANTSYTYSTIGSQNITLAANVDLSNTGFVNLTRDNDIGNTGDKCTFSAIFNGANGNSYYSVTYGGSTVYRHSYTGLVGIANGATIQNVDFKGDLSVSAYAGLYAGSTAGYAKGAFTASNIIASTTIHHSGSKVLCLGGILGEASSDIAGITVSDISANATITGNASNARLGGVIGRINHTDVSQIVQWNFTDINISGNIENTNSIDDNMVGGLIAVISGGSAATSRALNLTRVNVNDLNISVNANSNGSVGGLLGYSWRSVNVNFDDVVIGTVEKIPEIIQAKDSSTGIDFAGLVYAGSGYWRITQDNDLKINSMKLSSDNAQSFGMIINRGWFKADDKDAIGSALYLELQNFSAYSIVSANVSFTKHSTNNDMIIPVFDELVAHTAFYTGKGASKIDYFGNDPDNLYILQNGQSIVSIRTVDSNGGLVMDGTSASGTYTPKTTYGKQMNPYARYYYNLDLVKNASSGAAGLMSWGAKWYANETIKTKVSSNSWGVTIPDGTYNMRGYSWYPLNIDKATVTLNGTFSFYNKEFEASELIASSFDSNHSVRTSLYDSGTTQHYLMHASLFNDVHGKITIGTVTLNGSIPQIDTTRTVGSNSIGGKKSGALILGTLKGSGSTDDATAQISTTSVILAGIYVHNFDVNDTDDYAPLLINNTDDFSTLTIRGVEVASASSYKNNSNIQTKVISGSAYPKAATSLIGNVGASKESKNINIMFMDIKLDGRDAVLSLPGLSSAYYTDVSIFTRATLLNRLCFDTGKGVYTYNIGDDWNNGAHSTDYCVTYGMEVGYDDTADYVNTQYPNQERWYLDTNPGTFVNPISSSDSDGDYSSTFVSSYLPYVAVPYNRTEKHYQLEVNHTSSQFGGCGTYNDPYTITNGEDFQTIYNILASETPGSAEIYLPMKNALEADFSATWHSNEENKKCKKFVYAASKDVNGTTYTNYYWLNGGSEKGYPAKDVRTYVAGAYYQIKPANNGTSITISNANFKGLGNTTDNYAQFRGVIVGNGNDTIINKTSYPLIAYSNGSVVKDVRIEVDMNSAAEGQPAVTGTISKTLTSAKAYDASGDIESKYGAVISSVLGGDNIIDGVTVTFKNTSIELTGAYAHFIPVGGYVGVILNGGVIFRGMENKTTGISGLPSEIVKSGSATDLCLESNRKWLYVNPIIGRVINGFAVTEASAYRPFEDGTRVYHGGAKTLDNGTEDTTGLITEYWAKKKSDNSIGVVDSATYNTSDYTLQPVTMRNGNKHYSIADINSADSKLDTNGSSANVEIPNGQAFFIMSIAVNSGMSNKTLGYNQVYQVSRSAQYSKVETNLTALSDSVSDYNSYAKNDVLNSSNKAANRGYIFKNYTIDDTDVSGASSKTVKLTASKGKYYLPDGYKGIGNIFQNSDGTSMKITSFNGNDATISQNTYFYYYDDASNHTYSPVSAMMGLGLINYIKVTGTYQNFYLTGNLTTDLVNKTDGSFVSNKKASELDPISNNNAQNSIYLSAGMLLGAANTADVTVKNTALENIYVFGLRNTGGMIGYLYGSKTLNYTIQDSVADDDYNSDIIKVHGRASTGGLVGKINTGFAKVNMNNHTFNLTEVVCECTNRSGNYYDYGVGGFIGMMRAGQNSIDSEDNPTSNYFKNIVIGTEDQVQKVTCTKGAEMFTAGVVGILNKCKGIKIENCTFYNLSVEAKFAAAGLVAFPTTYTPAVVSNTHFYSPLGSTIESKSDYAGGLIGSSDPRTENNGGSQKFTFNNCSVEGYTISGKKGAGGAIGFRGAATSSGVRNLVINNTKIQNCVIKSDGSAGSLIGEMNEPVVGYNILSKNVTLDSYTANGSITNAGYICGRITTSSENVTYNNDTQKVTGTKPNIKIVGFSRQADDVDSMMPDLVGTCNYGTGFGTDGYVIFADYNDYANSAAMQNNSFSNIPSDPTNVATMRSKKTVVVETYENGSLSGMPDTKVVYGEYKTSGLGTTTTYSDGTGTSANYTKTTITVENENYPYVTSSRKMMIDSLYFLTGDGVSSQSYDNSLAFAKIIADVKSGTNKAYTVCDSLTAEEVENIENEFSNSTTEFKNYLDSHSGNTIKQFPLLIAEDTNPESLTALINNYLDALTNTNYNFAETNSSIYKLGLYKCEYDGNTNKFLIGGNGTANLKVRDSQFYMKADSVDSREDGMPQFSLIDVMFIDPIGTNVAYHLYVPVYVKKVLRFDFNAEIKSGTDYYRDAYTNLANGLNASTRTQGLFENLGNPVTIAFEYEYTRTADEWKEAINNGDSILTNYYKSLSIKNHNSNNWADVTRLVLVDANNNDKHYYLDTPPTMNNVQFTNISFYDFVDANGNRFEPAPLQNLMSVTVAQSDAGTLTPTTGNTPNGATVFDGTTYYRPISDNDGTLANNLKYSVTQVSNLVSERYYLTIFTKADSTDHKIYSYEIKSPESFSNFGTGVTYTENTWQVNSWRANKIDKSTILYLFMGDLYENNLTLSVSSQKDGALVMASDNRYLKISMIANVGLTQTAVNNNIFKNMDNFKNKANIYQGFLMMYDKLDPDGSSTVGIDRAAEGSIGSMSYTYKGGKITASNYDPSSATAVSGEHHNISEKYVEIMNDQNLISELCKAENNYSVTLQAYYEMVYAPNDLSTQFPKKDEGSNAQVGSCVIGYSKIASTTDGVASSAAFDKETDSTRYYTSDESTATLNYNVVTGRNIAGLYHYLGINSIETGDDESYVDTYAIYDTRSLKNPGDYIELTLTLSNKASYVVPSVGNPLNSGTALPISGYLTDLKIYGMDSDNNGEPDVIFEQGADDISTSTIKTTDGSTIYRVRVNKSLLKQQSEGVYYIPIDYNVVSGNTAFNNSGKMYSNYKVTLTAAMYSEIDSAENTYSKTSYAYDHIIYTNARVMPEVIDN